jgi:hypothetical protein
MYATNYARPTIQPISFDRLRLAVPSAFAEKPYHKTSESYAYIPTYPLIEVLQSAGWQPIKAYESRTRISDKRGYVKHLIRFVNPDMKLPAVGDTFQSLVLTNSHDATSAYHVYNAVYRLVCCNGMVSQQGANQDVVRIRHSGRAIEQLRNAHNGLLETAAATAKEVEDFSIIDLTPDERGIFARAALDLRWSPEENEQPDGVIKLIETAPIKAESLLSTRRAEDRLIQNSLWGTLNIAQENLMQGGLRGRTANGGRTTTREIKSVDTDVRLNKALWRMAQEMKALKAS